MNCRAIAMMFVRLGRICIVIKWCMLTQI